MHIPLGSSYYPMFPDRIGIWNVGLFGWAKTGRPGENPSKQGPQLTWDARSGNRTWTTAAGGERSHHCAIPHF